MNQFTRHLDRSIEKSFWLVSYNLSINVHFLSFQASYGVSDPLQAVTQLSQTTLRAEIGRLSLDNTFAERGTLSSRIAGAINHAADAWGIKVNRYELKDIVPTPLVPSPNRKYVILSLPHHHHHVAHLDHFLHWNLGCGFDGKASCGRAQAPREVFIMPRRRKWRPIAWNSSLLDWFEILAAYYYIN